MESTAQSLICAPDTSFKRYLVLNFTREEDIRKALLESLSLSPEEELETNGHERQEAVLSDVVNDLMNRVKLYRKPCKMNIQLAGEMATQRVWLFGQEIFPEKSLLLKNHSPSGFNWGFGGSGPAQLALALCLELMGEDKALQVYQDFKFKHIATLPQKDFESDFEIDF